MSGELGGKRDGAVEIEILCMAPERDRVEDVDW